MKRSAIIVAVLIAVVALIGFERIGQGLGFPVFDDRAAGARGASQTAGSEVARSTRPSDKKAESSHIATRADDQSLAEAVATEPINEQGPMSVAGRISGEISPMHFVRISTILGRSERSEEEIDRLREALAVVGDALHPIAVIFDADGFSTSEAPVLLFARDEFDLTDQVKASYDALKKPPIHPSK